MGTVSDPIKSWGEVFYDGFVSMLKDQLDPKAWWLVPTWSELPDHTQLHCEEKARELVSPVFQKHFGDAPEAEAAVFDIGQGNLDRAEEELHLHHPDYQIN